MSTQPHQTPNGTPPAPMAAPVANVQQRAGKPPFVPKRRIVSISLSFDWRDRYMGPELLVKHVLKVALRTFGAKAISQTWTDSADQEGGR